MSELISVLRGMGDAELGDWTRGTANYWDSTQLEIILDRHRREVWREPLTRIPRVEASVTSYYEYRSQWSNFEQTTGGTAIFWLEDSTGANVGTANYSVDYLNGRITFTADQGGTIYYLTGRAYDLDGAAADVWRVKGSHYALAYDISTDNQSLKRSQLLDHCARMADYYDAQGEPVTSLIVRDDVL